MHDKVSAEICDFTRHVVTHCALDSASILLCDRTGPTPRLSYLYHVGIAEEVKDRYLRHTIFHLDPFTDPEIQERPDLIGDDGVLAGTDDRVGRRPTGDRYWSFMSDHGIEVIGASTRRLRHGLYSTIGFHRRGARALRDPVTLPHLDHLARRLQDMVTGHMLRTMLDQAHGMGSLNVSYFGQPAAAADTTRAALSPREREIADQVCLGRLNKEIAHATCLSEHTVENHLRRIYAKLSIHNRSALVALMTSGGPGSLH